MVTLDDSDGVNERLEDEFIGRPGVGTKMAFGRRCLTINDKIFAIFRLGELVVKLPIDTGEPLIESGEARQFEPAPGRAMKQWYMLGAELDEARWLELAEASFDYVLALQA